MSSPAIVIHGATGRNGQRLIAHTANSSQWQLIGAIASSSSEFLGRDIGTLCGLEPCGVGISDQWPDKADVVIDFSNAAAAIAAVKQCVTRKIPIVVASTGLTVADEAELKSASQKIPICYAANFSPAVNLTMKLAQQAAATLAKLNQQVDVEIIERHHRLKVDSPSGTALKFGALIGQEMGIDSTVHGREGIVGQRPSKEIGYHAVRLGDDAGQHLICFGMMGELIELRCAASNRDPYAIGALTAAKFLLQQKPGLYDMFDVLGL